MSRKFLALFAVLVGIALVVPDLRPAVAQNIQVAQANKRPGLFERLFGPRKSEPPKIIKRSAPVKKRSVVRKKPTVKRAPAPTVKTVEVAPKDPNARKILVVGDYVASGIAWGLDQALAKETKIEVDKRFDGSSGLVRADYFDWNEKILEILNEENPDVVVVALGANDRQDLRDGNQRHPIKSPTWEEVYSQRVSGLVDTLKVYGRPFFWVSAPPIRGTSAMADIAYINGLYKPLVEKAGGHYVDVWNGFTNASGQYITSGPDIDGQTKALRTSDGVNFTGAGKLKLAYYVERDIRRTTGLGSGDVDLLPSTTLSSTIEIGPDGKKRLVGPIISLSDPLPGGSAELAGKPDPVIFDPVTATRIVPPKPAVQPPAEEDETPQYRLVVKGEALTASAGRIDDFEWPPRARASQMFVSPAEPAPDGEAADEAAAEDGEADGEASLTPVSKSSQ